MIGHQHVGIANLLVHLDRLHKVDIALIRKHLDKVVPAPANIAEMDVEYLFARAKVANHIKYLDARILQVLRDGSLAEVQAVVGALLNGDKPLQSVDSAQHALNTLIAFRRNAGVLRMAGHANLVFVRNRNHPVEKLGDAFPEGVGVYAAGLGEWWVGVHFGELPIVIHRIAAAGRASRPENAEDAHVVFDAGDPGLRAVADKGLQRLDVAVALGTLGQHDGRMSFRVDKAGLEKRRRRAVDADAVLGGHIHDRLQLVYGGIQTVTRDLRIAANILHAVAG